MPSAISVRPEPINPPTPRISPFRNSKLTSLKTAAIAKTTDAENGLVRLLGWRLFFRIKLGDLAPDHAAHDVVRCQVRNILRGDIAPVAKHGDPVAQAENLGHAMADIDDRNALRLQVADDPEQDLGFRFRQGRCRLVEDQHAAIERQRLGDLHQLLAGNGQFGDLAAHVDRRQPVHHGLRVALQPAIIHKRRAAAVGGRHEHVLGHRRIRAKRDFLVHEPKPERLRHGRRRHLDRRAINEHLALRRLQYACNDVHQRRFSRAVFAAERMDLALFQAEVHVRQRLDGTEVLADIADFQNRHRRHDNLLLQACGGCPEHHAPDSRHLLRRASSQTRKGRCTLWLAA